MARVYRTSRWVSPLVLALGVGLASPAALAAPAKPKAAAAPVDKDAAARKEAMELGAQAQRLIEKKQYDAALAPAQKALALNERIDPEGGMTKANLYQLAQIYDGKGDHARAASYYERKLALVEKKHSNDAEVLFAWGDLGHAQQRAGEHERAITTFEHALVLAVKHDGGKEGERAAGCFSDIAFSQKALRRYDAAEAAYVRAVKILEGLQYPMGSGLHWAVLDLGSFYHDMGAFTRAEPILTRGLEIQADRLTRENSTSTMLKVAWNRMALEDFHGAEVLLDEVVRIAQSDGEESSFFAVALMARGSLDVDTGAYDSAAPTLERAARIVRKLLDEGKPGMDAINATLQATLGELATAEGDFPRAEASLARAKEFFEKNGKPKEKAEVAAAFAELYQKAKRFDRAETYAREALVIRDAELPETHPKKAESRAILGRIREARGDAASARKLHEQALATREAAFGKEHPFAARSRLDLADLARRQGRFDDAEADYKRAIGIFEKTFGPEHDKVAAGLEGMSALYAAKGKLDLAIRTAERAAEIRERQAALVIAGGSEAQKRAFVATMRAGSDWVASLHARFAPTDERAKRLALTTILQRKGRVLDVMASSLSALRQRLSPADAALFDELSAARADVAKLAMRGPAGAPLDAFRAELAEREAKAHAIEDKLGQASGALRAEQTPVTIERVQALLQDGAVMIELSLYSPRTSADTDAPNPEGAPRVSAYVLDGAGKVSFVDLGESAPIESATKDLRGALASPNTKDTKTPSRALFDLVMQKILPLVPGKTKLFVSADGALSLVPIAALVDEAGKYLVERYEITYLTSGRDLLRFARTSPPGQGALVVADPAFGPRPGGESALAILGEPADPAGKNRGLDKAYFEPLPATAGEARAIGALLPRADVRIDIEATESSLKKRHAPRLLHVATHGFFLSAKRPQALLPPPPAPPAKNAKNEKRDSERGLELVLAESPDWLPDDPLLRSGLAFSGANAKNGGDGEDGILTALEASSIDLWGTKLVVLSACETGLGDVQRGEGVYGLRRALFIAGAETLVASLWKVADEETKALMVGYYERILKGTARSAALRDVQLAMLASPATAHPYYWASFGVFGDPSPMGPEAAPKADVSPADRPVRAASPAKITITARGCACRAGGPEGEAGGAAPLVALALAFLLRKRPPRGVNR